MTVLSQSDVQPGEGTLRIHTPRRPRNLLPGSKVAYAYVLPFLLVFAAFSV